MGGGTGTGDSTGKGAGNGWYLGRIESDVAGKTGSAPDSDAVHFTGTLALQAEAGINTVTLETTDEVALRERLIAAATRYGSTGLHLISGEDVDLRPKEGEA